MNSSTCKIYLVRHGQSEANAADRIGGHWDTALTELGKSQAKDTKAELKGIKFDNVYSSDLQRATDTAAIIYGSPVPQNHQLADLRERNYGDLERKADHALKDWHSSLMSLEPDQRWHYKHIESMESDEELMARFIGALKTIGKSNPGKTVLVAAHGGCIRGTLVKLGHAKHEDIPPKAFKNAGYVELTYDGQELNVERVEGIDQQVVDQHRR